jgi:hypothetical protein
LGVPAILRTLAFMVALLAWLPAAPALASGDFGCEPVWNLTHAQFDDCSSTGFLSPGNDSRINLQMLMLDQRGVRGSAAGQAGDPVLFSLDDFNAAVQTMVSGKPPKAPDDAGDSDLAVGEGSRCVSNSAGAAGFDAALTAAKGLPDDERTALASARDGLAPDCAGGAAAKLAAAKLAVKSKPGRQFATYLTGAAAFYDGDFDTAHKAFADLAGGDVPWLREAARYMLGRVELNRAQVGAFQEFSATPDPGKIDVKALDAAQADFLAYLHDYPRGAYAASARGLLRRVDWLGGRAGPLSDEYARLIVQADWTTGSLTAPLLAQEIDSKLLSGADRKPVKSPLLLATLDLMQMRPGDPPADAPPDSAPAKPSLALADLEAQRPLFAKDPALFGYLLAAHRFYVEKDPAGALALLPAQGDGAGYLGFSRQMLRGMALEALKDKGARAHWTALHARAQQPYQPGAVELGLALDHERAGDLDPVFAPGSIVRNSDIRAILLQHTAGPALLRGQAQAGGAPADERRLALYVLLYKELTRGRYQPFLQDVALLGKLPAPPKDADGNAIPQTYDPATFAWNGGGSDAEAGYRCPSVREVAQILSQRAADPHGRLCLGEFVRENSLDGSELNQAPKPDQLGGAPTQFPGAPVARLEIYKAVIADPKAPVADRTYALYRAVQCYAPSGNNHCDGEDVPQAQRKKWFQTLKSTYASSPWAAALKYYW